MRKLPLTMILLILLVGCGGSDYNVTETTLNGEDVIYEGETWVDAGCEINAEHKKDETLSFIEVVYTDQEIDTTTSGIFHVQYEYGLGSNLYGCTRNVVVLEDESPDVSLNAGVDTVFVGEEHNDAGITASDNQEEELYIDIENTVDTSIAGIYTINYTVTDLDGNQVIVTRMVTVKNPE